MDATAMTRPQARLELALWQAEADQVDDSDLYVQFRELGMPPEIAIPIRDVIGVVKRVGEKLISLGKIVVLKLIQFVKQHPNLAVGVALGACLSTLIGSIPLLGPLLAAVALPFGITVGGVLGHRLDQAESGNGMRHFTPVGVGQDLIQIARAFLEHFIQTIQALTAELTA